MDDVTYFHGLSHNDPMAATGQRPSGGCKQGLGVTGAW